ncbi:acetyltransferase [Frankia sp. CNm7]|uniref:Lysine N-acyltransferase MbtK n=1 Tax=Frankia nepalensis TaxID=1836974 RepID=A0A937RAF8_9ACTN|nr:GNAT family N-acetyltransferase [Frankia nepalensis]MBL7498851.1 acetyltransferase [Frankia nepalensis]MBL7508656.1 acetyltransferase [Frankia nepalensis]MBL7521454.1 acetyltransferase [Frankia nepalensis]MBL7628431.1 acetyltransferase [Frankia nepalensis]
MPAQSAPAATAATESDEDNLLPRLRVAGLSPQVLAVPAPPLPTMPAPFDLRLADPDADAELVSEWMSHDLLIHTWNSAWPAERWRRYIRAQLDSDFSRPLMLSYEGTTVGYLELYRASRDTISTFYAADPWDLGLHAAVVVRSAMPASGVADGLRGLVEGAFRAEARCRRVMFEPDHRNTPARLVCERAGCQQLGMHHMPTRKIALYALPRDPNDAPPAYQSLEASAPAG